MIAAFAIARGMLLPLVLAGALAFAWQVKSSWERGAAAETELRLQAGYRKAAVEEERRVHAVRAERSEAGRTAQAEIERKLREEIDRLKARAPVVVKDGECGW